MDLKLTVPGKTFLMGEYGVLLGTSAVLFCNEPCFSFSIKIEGKFLKSISHDKNMGELINIHPESPAGKWFLLHQKHLNHVTVEFSDPYDGKGGLGASTAQFLCVYFVEKTLKRIIFSTPSLNEIDYEAFRNQFETVISESKQNIKNLISDYLTVAWKGEGTPPSGMDLVAQLFGGMVKINRLDNEEFKVEKLHYIENLKNTEIGFLFFMTENKLATHQHLVNISIEDLKKEKIKIQALVDRFSILTKENIFTSVKDFYETLKSYQLVSINSQEIVSALEKENGVFSLKGCGAMGSDIIFVVFDLNLETEIKQKINRMGFSRIFELKNVGQGLHIQNVVKD